MFFSRKYNKIKTRLADVWPFTKRIDWQKLIAKYLISGSLSTITHLLFLYLMHTVFGLNVIAATTVAFIVAFCVSFSLQKFWTFRDPSRRYLEQGYFYLLIGLFNLFANAALMEILVNWWSWHYLLAQICISAAIAVNSFLLYKFLVFKK